MAEESQNQHERGKNRVIGVRRVVIPVLLAYIVKTRIPYTFPHGFAQRTPTHERPKFSNVDIENDSMKAKSGKLRKIYENIPPGSEPLVKGPESVLFDNGGTLFVLTEEAKLVSLTQFEDKPHSIVTFANATEVMHLGPGRPLGGKFAKDGTLYFADAALGLCRVKNPAKAEAKVELIASRVMVDREWQQLLYVNDIDIGPKSGKVYFTDSTDIAPERIGTRTWDTMYASKIDAMRGSNKGKVLCYDPKTGNLEVLASGFYFANGIAVDKDETHLIIAETFRAKAQQLWISGPKTGTVEEAASGFPGYPDGADCSFETGKCYLPFPSSALPMIKAISFMPDPIDAIMRTLLMSFPKALAPSIKAYGGIAEIIPGDGSHSGQLSRLLQDPKGEDIGMLTGNVVHNGQLYMGSLKNPYIGVFDLN